MSNRRLVLVDQGETPNYTKFFGCSLNNEVYTIQTLDCLEEQERNNIIANLGPGDAIMSVGANPFKYLKNYYHFGVRNENFSDCAKLFRLSLEGGAFLKEVLDLPSKEEIDAFLDSSFTTPVKFPNFRQDLISDLPRALKFIDYMDSLPDDQYYGFDYEASGMPLDKEFYISGAALVTESVGAFISFTDIRRTLGGEDNPGYKKLCDRLGAFLYKRQDHIWVYNMQYEWLVSHRCLGVDLFNLCDASVVNVIDGFHLKKYSLKWTAQRVLGATVWDTEFDRISDLIDQMYFEEVGKLKRDKHKVIKVSPNDFENTPEWQILAQRYPQDINEMRQLVHEYWGMPFMVPSSRLLGYYCCLDSFYTLMIALSRLPKYSKDCWQVNLDNTRLGCRLMGSGLYIDEPYRKQYESYCEDMQVWAITYCAQARCYFKMEKHKALGTNLKRYKPVAQKLITQGKFFNGDPVEIVKDLMLTHLDTLSFYDTGLNEGGIALEYGPEFANAFITVVKNAMAEVKMKTPIDESIKRKKKILGIIAENSKPILGLNKAINKKKLIELEKFMYYQEAYKELDKVAKKQLIDIHNVPDKIYYMGEARTKIQYADLVQKNLFQCKSPEENNLIALEFTELFKTQTCFLTGLIESTQQLPNTDTFYSSRLITDIHDAFAEFMDHWKVYVLERRKSTLYPDKIFDLALKYFQNPEEDKNKETWTNFNGYIAQSRFFPQVNEQYEEYERHFDPADVKDDFFFMRKLVINYLTYKKYAKLQSTYVGSDGMFHKTGKWVIEGPDHIPLREADPNEPNAVWKVFVHYEVNTKSSKRWSSPFHTIISHGDCKDCLCPPPAWDKDGNIIYGGSNQILTYFDISSAEVKAAGYASGDPDLIAKFEKGEDIYIYSAQLYLGEDGWNKLSKKAKKKWRKRFKTVFLGVLYGLGKNSLAERLECDLEEADKIIQGLYKSFPKLREYVERQSTYPMTHGGYINTMLGDKLLIKEYSDFLPKAKTNRERNNIIARIGRLGVNLPIQGGTSSIMACGFYNNIRVSILDGATNKHSLFYQHALQPIIVVHDSNTNYVPVDAIFDIRSFYDTHYTEYCHNIGPGIYLLFDLLVGYSYELADTLVQVDPNTIEFSGSAYSILKLYDKLMQCSFPVECNMSREDIENSIKFCTDPYDRFIREEGCNMVKDLSKITVQFHRNI